MANKVSIPTKVITGINTRWSYANVWDPKSINGRPPKYSVSLIIPKSDTVTLDKINAAIQAAYEEGQSKLKGSASPFRLLQHSSFLSATVTRKDRIMKLTRTATSSTPTAHPHPVSWTRTGILSLNVPKYIPVCTAGLPSICMLSTATATRVSPAV